MSRGCCELPFGGREEGPDPVRLNQPVAWVDRCPLRSNTSSRSPLPGTASDQPASLGTAGQAGEGDRQGWRGLVTSACQTVWSTPRKRPMHSPDSSSVWVPPALRGWWGVISGMGRCVVAGWSPGVYLFTGADGPDLGEEPGSRFSRRPASCLASASKPKTNPAEEAVSLPEEEIAKARTQPKTAVLSGVCSRLRSISAGAAGEAGTVRSQRTPGPGSLCGHVHQTLQRGHRLPLRPGRASP